MKIKSEGLASFSKFEAVKYYAIEAYKGFLWSPVIGIGALSLFMTKRMSLRFDRIKGVAQKISKSKKCFWYCCCHLCASTSF